MNEMKLKQIIAEELNIARLSETRGPVEEPAAPHERVKNVHIDRSLGYFIADYLKKRMKERRFREAIVNRMADRDDLYTPGNRSGLTKDIVTRTMNVVIEEIKTDLEEMIEDIIKQLMIKWRLW